MRRLIRMIWWCAGAGYQCTPVYIICFQGTDNQTNRIDKQEVKEYET